MEKRIFAHSQLHKGILHGFARDAQWCLQHAARNREPWWLGVSRAAQWSSS